MSETDKLFAGSIPQLYDRYLVPLIFQPYAEAAAAAIADLKPAFVLETACGTGAVTRAMAARLPSTTTIVATDLNPPMLDHAASRQAGDISIQWRQADALALPFPAMTSDVVVCQFGAMFFPDKVQAYREAHRVLKPGGCYLLTVWGELAANQFTDVVTAALVDLFPEAPPRFLARTPHGYHDVERIRRELATAGFASISVATLDRVSRADSARDAAVALCQGTPVRNEIPAARLEEATEAAATALARRFGTGPIEGGIRAHMIMARR
jgi:ubiquinone/menaquinone biosynthesis C-methylase UbiE